MSYLILLLIFAALYAYLVWKDFDLALYLLLLLLPSYLIRFDIGPLPSTALEVMIGVVVLGWIIRVAGDKGRLKALTKSLFFWPGLVLVIAAGVSTIWAADTLAALGIFKAYFVEPFLIYLVLVDTFKSRDQWKRALVALGLSVVLMSILAIIQRITGWWSPTWEWTLPESRRVAGLFTSPNALGLFVGPVTALYVAWLFVKERTTNGLRLFQVLVIAAGSLSILLAVSKGALIALAVAVLAIMFFGWSKKHTAAIAFGLFLIIFFLPITRQPIVDVFTFQIESGQSRLALYQGSWELIKNDPVKGIGLASFGSAFESVRSEGFTEKLIYPHNIFLNFWSETGLLGLASILWIIGIIVWTTIKNKKFGWNWVFIAAMITMLVHGLVDVPYFKNDLAVLSWFVLAGYACSNKIRSLK